MPRPKGNGGTYEYFVCGGRMHGSCSQGYHRAAAVEAAVERYDGNAEVAQLSEAERDGIRQAVRAYIGDLAEKADEQVATAKAEVARLAGEERKLLQAHYADQISPALFAEE